ncbi:MAG: universal stress protein [Halalkalicoccus sp.]|nr:universal stress protein [Halalkalicoccus sp.]
MYDRILIPTDGSNAAEKGVEHGIELASRYDAMVDTLYVIDERLYNTPALSSTEAIFEKLEADGETAMDLVAERAAEAGVEVATHVVRGLPHERIVEFADEHDDLIVMGKRGLGGVSPPHIGSVTDRVFRTANVPVFPV